MKTKKKVLLEEDAHYELSINEKKDKKVYKLKLSTADHIPMESHGSESAKLVDDGNCIEVNGVKYEYCEFEALMILGKELLNDQKGMWSETLVK